MNWSESDVAAYQAKRQRASNKRTQSKPQKIILKSEAKKKSKYRNKKTEVDGILFDSAKEASRYCELKLLEKAGAIENLECQSKFLLIEKNTKYAAVTYLADFTYWDPELQETVVEDTKGMKTPLYVIKKKLMYAVHGIEIREL